ncbi:MAG TPA: hypothetical protein DCE08_07610 [Ruminococcaceae bacterium]|nr:hypothetical protein [Oscillospiraceae bacterium]
MKTFELKISSPDGDLFSGEAVNLSLRGTLGDLAVMAGHTPLMTAVKAGEFRVTLPDDTEKVGKTTGGLLTVSKERTTFLSDGLTWTE